ncbi:MAG: hypothetical protein ACKV22_30415, partial [Bryobacteraceae bacterium]
MHYFSRYSSSTGGDYSGYKEPKVIGPCPDGSYSFNGQFDAAINVPGASVVTRASAGAVYLSTNRSRPNASGVWYDGASTFCQAMNFRFGGAPSIRYRFIR